jgi:transposase
MRVCLSDDLLVSDAIEVGAGGGRTKRVHRTAQEKRRIVEATLVPGASIARVARENGVNANQVFQWRYEYRKGVCWAAIHPRAEFLPVTVIAEQDSVIELPGRALVSVVGGVDVALVRAVLGSLLR